VSEFVTELHGVSKAFRFFELRDVTLRLAPGQILGLVGPNGAGKSTTMRILMAFVEQDRGEVKVLGHAMPRQQAAAKREVGFVSEEMGLCSGMLDRHDKGRRASLRAALDRGRTPSRSAAVGRAVEARSPACDRGVRHADRCGAQGPTAQRAS
jgi:ABC-type Na+ transport system ATPase subunit NatA